LLRAKGVMDEMIWTINRVIITGGAEAYINLRVHHKLPALFFGDLIIGGDILF